MTLRQQFVMHLSLARGGYAYSYRLIDDSGAIVGHKSVERDHAKAKQVTTFFLGDAEFRSYLEFAEALQKQVEAKRRDQEWEAAAPK
jgi:hypothetical protein